MEVEINGKKYERVEQGPGMLCQGCDLLGRCIKEEAAICFSEDNTWAYIFKEIV